MNSEFAFFCTTISWSCAKLSSRNTTTLNIEIHVMVMTFTGETVSFLAKVCCPSREWKQSSFSGRRRGLKDSSTFLDIDIGAVIIDWLGQPQRSHLRTLQYDLCSPYSLYVREKILRTNPRNQWQSDSKALSDSNQNWYGTVGRHLNSLQRTMQ